MEYDFSFIPHHSNFDLMYFTSFPPDTPKKNSIDRLAKKQAIAQKGIDRIVRLGIMGNFTIDNQTVFIKFFCKAFIEDFKLYVIHIVDGREAVLQVSPTMKSFYKLYI